MSRIYPEINTANIKDRATRSALDAINIYLRDLARSSSQNEVKAGTDVGNAPDNQPYVTIGNSTRLTMERALVATTPIVATDGGANTNVNLTLTTVPIAKGGTGQITQTEGFDALAPTTTKGDLIVHDGSDNIRLAKGTDTNVLTADSAEASGLKWAASGSASDVALYVKMFVPTATTVTVPTKHQIVCCEEYLIEGTGVLELEGTAKLCIDGVAA